MKHIRLNGTEAFYVALGNRHSQAAEMVLAAGESEGNSNNRHRGSDQWLYVVSGMGTAIVKGKRYPLRAGTLMLIEKGDAHEIRNTGRVNCELSTFTCRRRIARMVTRCRVVVARAANKSTGHTGKNVIASVSRSGCLIRSRDLNRDASPRKAPNSSSEERASAQRTASDVSSTVCNAGVS